MNSELDETQRAGIEAAIEEYISRMEALGFTRERAGMLALGLLKRLKSSPPEMIQENPPPGEAHACENDCCLPK